jgi:hypothetical protein
VPHSFKQTHEFLDANVLYKLDFPANVLTTDFSERMKLAGLPVSEIKIWQMCYMKEENWMLRWLANGNFLSIEFARSVAESVLSSKILSLLRNSTEQNLEELARHYAATNDLPFKEIKDQKIVFNKLAEMAVANLRSLVPAKPDEQANTRIKELEKQLADAKSLRAPKSESSVPKLPIRPKAKNKPALEPVLEEVVAEDDEEEEESLFQPAHEPTTKPLGKSEPEGSKPSEVKAWIEGLGLGQKKKEQLLKITNHIQAKFKASTIESKQEDLEELARLWGLPLRTIVSTPAVQLIRIICAAYTQTN